MKFPFTFFVAKPKAVSVPCDPQTGEKRRRADSEDATDDPEPSTKRSRTTMASEDDLVADSSVDPTTPSDPDPVMVESGSSSKSYTSAGSRNHSMISNHS